MTLRPTHRVINKTLTVLGAERRLFAVALLVAGVAYMQTHHLKLALVLFAIGHFLAFLLTRYDERIIDVLRRVFSVKSSYDPIKHQQFAVKVKQ
jgi:type IV secretory pathway TrbD component